MPHPLHALFSPRSIAVVGASRDRSKLGYQILDNIVSQGFGGKIYPVNPKAKRLHGLDVYRSVSAIGKPVDLAVIVVPQQLVARVLEDCGQAGVELVIVITAGFKETGEAGAQAEGALVELARKYDMHLLGPNCLGMINTGARLNASFAVGMPQAGGVGFISQSGAMAVGLLDWAQLHDIGFSKIISIGNKADIDEVELLEYLGSDPETKVIALYLESLDRGRAFVEAASRITPHKPIVVLKVGVSEQGKAAISSHTGSLAGADVMVETALTRAGVIRVHSMTELFDVTMLLSNVPIMKGQRLTILTNAGGPGIAAVDAAQAAGVQIVPLSSAVQTKLRSVLPPAANVHNPIDVIGDAPAQRYADALQTILKMNATDAVLVLLTPQTTTEIVETARVIMSAQNQFKIPIATSFIGGSAIASGSALLRQHHIPQYETPERAVTALAALCRYSVKRSRTLALPPLPVARLAKTLPDHAGYSQIRTMEAEKLLSAYGIPVLRSQLVRSIAECRQLSQFPIVMKCASRDIVHKAASGAIVLSIHTAADAVRAFRQIEHAVAHTNPTAEFEGVLVQPQLATSSAAVELICGLKRDPAFGPVVMVGLGGSLVEILHDVVFALAPLNRRTALQLIMRLWSFPLLEQLDLTPVIDALIGLGRIALDYPAITQIDINPLIVQPRVRQTRAVDVRIMSL